MKSKWSAGLLGFIALFTSLSMVSVPSTANEVVGAVHSKPLDNTDRLIVKFRDPATHAGVLSPALASSVGASAGVELTHLRALAGGAHVFKMPQSVGLEEARAVARRLSTAPDIAYAEPDQMMHVMLIPNDTQYLNQWHYKEFTTEIAGLNLPPAWDITTGSTATVVAVIDTGLRPHADIDTNILDGTGRVVPGYDFIAADGGPCTGSACFANDGDGRDADPSDPGDWITVAEDASGFFAGCGVSNSSWHGTHVSGTVGALSNNGVGVAGVNWATRILPVRVLGKCGGFTSDIADGMRWAAGLAVSGVPANANPAKVLNLSLGGAGACSATFQSAVNAVVTAGSVVVVAAGNSNIDAANSQPGNCNNVLTVAALNRSGGKAYYSNFGAAVEIAAPGGAQSFANDPNGVLSTLNTGTTTPAADSYVYYQGTSMAAPHVAGVASLMFGVNPSLTPAQITGFLVSSARAFPTGTGSDCTTLTCGAGMVNAAAAVQAAAPTGPTVTLSASPTTVAVGGASTLTWSSTNATSCTASGGWLGTRPTSGSESTGALAASTTFTLTCTGAGGSASQSVTVAVTPAPTVTLSASPTTVVAGGSSTLTWSSTNATSCSASGGWSGSKPVSGSESTGALTTTTTFTLSCTGAGGSASQSATVTVTSATNKPPVAKAGPDQKVKEEKTVTLNGSASFDPDGTIVSYVWKQIAGKAVTLSSPNDIITRFKAPSTKRPLDLVFTLTVTDDKGASDVDRVKVRVVPVKDDH